MSAVLEKAIRLIDLVAKKADNLDDLSKRSGLSRSTAHRLLATLVKHNYLTVPDRKYELGNRLLELGVLKRRSYRFVDLMRPTLIRFAEETQDTIHLAVLDGVDIVLIDRVFGNRQLQINSYPGLRSRAYATAVGKVLIAHRPKVKWDRYLQDIPASYVKTKDQLLVDLAIAQKTNTASDMDEVNVGTCGIASSFLVDHDTRVACSINGASVYFQGDRLKHMAQTVLSLAAELQKQTYANTSSIQSGMEDLRNL